MVRLEESFRRHEDPQEPSAPLRPSTVQGVTLWPHALQGPRRRRPETGSGPKAREVRTARQEMDCGTLTARRLFCNLHALVYVVCLR